MFATLLVIFLTMAVGPASMVGAPGTRPRYMLAFALPLLFLGVLKWAAEDRLPPLEPYFAMVAMGCGALLLLCAALSVAFQRRRQPT